MKNLISYLNQDHHLKKEKVVILGASDNPERYSYKALKMLQEYDHEVILVSPRLESIDGQQVYSSMKNLKDIDTLTMYVNPKISTQMKDEILEISPSRVIFNPGTENPELMKDLEAKGVSVEAACTLVLLSTDQF